MSNLVLTRNGRVARRNRPTFEQFPSLGNLLTDIWSDELPTVFRSNFNEGMTLPKVNISVENEELLIAAEVEENTEEKNEGFTRREFGYASFQRTFVLPETVDGDKIKANYSDGILSVHLPKKEEAKPKPARTIKVS